MFKYLLILNLLVMTVVTQDIPPPDWDLSTRPPTTTAEPTTPEPITTTTAETTTTTEEPITTTTERTTTTTEEPTTNTPEPTTTPTEEPTTITPEPTTTTTLAPTTTNHNDFPYSPTTDSPFTTSTTTTTTAPNSPFYPSYPDYYGHKCYFKKQYGFAQLRWTCKGLKYFYPYECFKCCRYEFSQFAGCYTVHDHYCNRVNHHHHHHYGFYKR